MRKRRNIRGELMIAGAAVVLVAMMGASVWWKIHKYTVCRNDGHSMAFCLL